MMKKRLMKTAIFGLSIALAAGPVVAQDLPTYVPQPVTVPDSASYLTRDGSVQIVGNDGWDAMVDQFNVLFLKTHPDFGRKFHTVLKGSSVAVPGLETGISAFAPMGRVMWETDRASFHRFHGYDPVDIRVGYDAFGPRRGGKTPPGIYVNASNPLSGLSVEQVKRVLTVGGKGGCGGHEGIGLMVFYQCNERPTSIRTPIGDLFQAADLTLCFLQMALESIL